MCDPAVSFLIFFGADMTAANTKTRLQKLFQVNEIQHVL